MIYFALFAAAVFGNTISSVATPACPDYSSELVCENCKCFGATKFNYKKTGDQAIITRSDCAQAAHDAGATYYSWLRNGAELFCSFNTHLEHGHVKFDIMIDNPTEEEVCGASTMDTDTTKPWKVFKLNPNTENCNCQIVIGRMAAEDHKCAGFEKLEKLKHGRTPATASDANACAKLSYQAGYTLFSYRADKEWCMYGHYYSDQEACESPNFVAADNWDIMTAECAENYFTYTLDGCVVPAGVEYAKSDAAAHVVCCPLGADPADYMGNSPTASCSRVDPSTNECFSTTPKSFTEAQAICAAAGMDTCQGPSEIQTCCGTGCGGGAGNSAKWWTATMASISASSPQQ